jgi:hypothetical protein
MKDNKNIRMNMVSAPVQAIESPQFKEVNNKDYILYGEKNDYPVILKEMMNQSSLHSAILKKKADMTAGQGFEFDTKEQKNFINNINGKENLEIISYKNSYDQVLYGGYCFVIFWDNKIKSEDKKISRIQYMDFSKVRIIKELELDDTEMSIRQNDGVDFYAISSDWTQERKEKYKPIIVQGFSREYNDATTQLVYVPTYRPGCQDTYPLPDYQACSTYIALDTEIAAWHLNSVKSGFTPSMLLNFIGLTSDEEMRIFERKFKEQYEGAKGASQVMITVSEDESQVPIMTPVNLNDSDQRYRDLAIQVKEQIIIGHRASNEVVGVAVAGKLGSSSEVIEAESMFQYNVITPYQKSIEDQYNRVMNFNGIEGEIKLKRSVSYQIDKIEEDEESPKENKED